MKTKSRVNVPHSVQILAKGKTPAAIQRNVRKAVSVCTVSSATTVVAFAKKTAINRNHDALPENAGTTAEQAVRTLVNLA